MPRRQHKVQPIERFPVKPRRDGRFQKRILGVFYYFGHNGDRKEALEEYERVKDDLYGGRVPRQNHQNEPGLPVRVLANRFLDDRKPLIEPDTFKQHRRALRRFVKFVGAGRAWDDLTPDDFTAYGRLLRGKVGAYAFNRERAAILAAFNHADRQGWIERCPKFGAGFARVPRAKLRQHRANRLLGFDDVASLLGYASPQIFAMILLGLNGGFGPTDCGRLPVDAVDFDGAMIHFPRTKNHIPRTIPLWPETVWALRRAMRRGADSLIFRTKYGKPWSANSIAHAVRRAVDAAESPLPKGIGLYAARHTFATYANEVRDTDARRHIMGRLLPNLDDIYVETVFAERLKAVTDHVRLRLQIPDIIGDIDHNPATIPHDPPDLG